MPPDDEPDYVLMAPCGCLMEAFHEDGKYMWTISACERTCPDFMDTILMLEELDDGTELVWVPAIVEEW